MTNIPSLCDRCNSWIITDNGKAIYETFNRSTAETIAGYNAPGVVIYTSLQWLQRINAQIAAQ